MQRSDLMIEMPEILSILIAIAGAHRSKITYVQYIYVLRTGAP